MTGAFGWSLTLHLQHLVMMFLVAMLSENWEFLWNYIPTLILLFPPFKALLTTPPVLGLKISHASTKFVSSIRSWSNSLLGDISYFALVGFKKREFDQCFLLNGNIGETKPTFYKLSKKIGSKRCFYFCSIFKYHPNLSLVQQKSIL